MPKGNKIEKSVVFARGEDTKRKAKFQNPKDDEGNHLTVLQGLIYLPKESVPSGKNLKVTVEFVDQDD